MVCSLSYEDLSTDEEEVEKCNRYNTRSAMRKKYVPQQNPSSIEELKENHRRENYMSFRNIQAITVNPTPETLFQHATHKTQIQMHTRFTSVSNWLF
jgi:hypothetical protein